MTFRPSPIRLMALALAIAAAPAAAFAQGAGLGAAGELVDPDVLRVCADPSNMPFTDESGEGFENKLADLVAEKTGRKSVAYTWFPMVMGFVRNTLRANRCDIIMGYAQGRRTRSEHKRLLPLDLRAGLQERERSRRGRNHRGSEARRQKNRRRRRNATHRQYGGGQTHAYRQDISADGGHAGDAVGG